MKSVYVGILMLISLFWLIIISRHGISGISAKLLEIDTSSGHVFWTASTLLLAVSFALAVGVIFYVAIYMVLNPLFGEYLYQRDKRIAIQEAQRYIDEEDTE
jgi:F0F1-type ATP synthase membrane subunit a